MRTKLGIVAIVLGTHPGAFVMEQKMLRGIKRRAERAHRSLGQSLNATPNHSHEEVA